MRRNNFQRATFKTCDSIGYIWMSDDGVVLNAQQLSDILHDSMTGMIEIKMT